MTTYVKKSGVYGETTEWRSWTVTPNPWPTRSPKTFRLSGYSTDSTSLKYRAGYPMWPDVSEQTIMENDVASQLQEQIQSAKFFESVAESKKTIKLLEGYAKTTLQLARGLRRKTVKWVKKYGIGIPAKSNRSRKGRKRPRADYLSQVPGEWLKFHFGLMPLKYTMDALLHTLDNPIGAMPVRCISRFSGQRVWRDPNYPGSKYSTYIDFDYQLSQKGFVRAKNPNQGFIARMGLSDIVGTAWELVPWSWAIDYFVNLGGALQRVNPAYKNLEFSLWSKFLMSRSSYRKNEYLSSSKTESTRGEYYQGNRSLGYFLYQSLIPGVNLSTQRLSYLMSAIALTLKGKFS